jgi:putative ABC transport system permease protein
VVRDTKEFSVDDEPPISIYHPHEQFPIGTMFVVIRTAVDPAQMTRAVTREIQALDPELPAFEFMTMDQRLSQSLARRRFSTLLLGGFALVALILAAIGIYGVIAYSVTQRTQEIGIRMALGARPVKIMEMVIRQSLILSVVGVIAGLAAAFALTRIMASLLYGISATDLPTFLVPPLVLGAVALVASYFPARRAARVDPTVALRSE